LVKQATINTKKGVTSRRGSPLKIRFWIQGTPKGGGLTLD